MSSRICTAVVATCTVGSAILARLRGPLFRAFLIWAATVSVIALSCTIGAKSWDTSAAASEPPSNISVGGLPGSTITVITIDGPIGENDFEAFKLKADTLVGNVVVFLSSPGGKLSPALQIGEYVRSKRWATFALDMCNSACGMIWLAGTPRVMRPYAKIGFHTVTINGQESGQGNALAGAFMSELGLNYKFIGWASAAAPEDIDYLTPGKAKELGVDLTVLGPGQQLGTLLSPAAPP